MSTRSEKQIDFKYLRNHILDNKVTEKDTVLLNSENFDDLVLEHRIIYNEGITIPFYFLRVLIQEDPKRMISLNRIRIISDDPARYECDFDPKVRKDRVFNALSPEEKKIYKCRECGAIVNASGSMVSVEKRGKLIGILEQFKDRLSPIDINMCQKCLEEYDREKKLMLPIGK